MSREQNNTPLLLALVACILVVAGIMVAAIFLAGQKPVVVVVSQPPAAPIAEVATVAASAVPTTPAAPVAKPPEVLVARVAAVPSIESVFDAAWAKVPSVEIPLQPQQVAPPMLATATIASISVQASHDDKRVAWRVSWPATQPATSVETGQFADAVAIQVPMVDGAPFTMGGKGMPVRLLHWKALWQRDIDKGFQDVQDLYPNASSDLYWFTQSKRLDRSYDNPAARQYVPALAAGNPMAQFDRKSPLEEIVAEGFGTATDVPDSPSNARGEWKDGRWTVVFDRAMDGNDPVVKRLQSASGNVISFAVWDGLTGNRGGRKHYCNWVPLKLEP